MKGNGKRPDAGTPDTQVAALPWRRNALVEILLVSSRETRRWVLPKGWPMKGRSLGQSAEREAHEEAGVEGEIAAAAIGRYRYMKRGKDGARELSVDVFPMRVTRERKHWPEEDERTRRWVSVEEAANAVDEPELKALIRAFGATLGDAGA